MLITPTLPQIAECLKVLPALQSVYAECSVISREGYDNLMEAVAATIISQQISTKAYLSILSKIDRTVLTDAKAFYEMVNSGGLKLSAQKTNTLKALSHDIANGVLTPQKLKACQSTGEVKKILCAYNGLGPWSADMLSIFYLGRLDVFACTDYGVRLGLTRALSCQMSDLDTKTLQDLTIKLQGCGTAASFYLWQLNALHDKARTRA